MATATTAIIFKLQKLLNHKQSAEAIGNVHEATAFAEKIQKLLTEHKLSITDIAAKEEEKAGVTEGSAVDPRRFGMKDKDKIIPWLLRLAQGIAKANDCAILVSSHALSGKVSNKFIFVGIDADRIAAEEFFTYMAKLIWEMAGKEGDRQKEDFRQEILYDLGRCAPGHLSAKLHNFRHSYCMGFANAVVERMTEERQRQMAAQAPQSTALVLVDRRGLAVRTHMQKYTATSKTKQYGAGGVDIGYALGTRDGKKVALTSRTINA